MSSYEDYLSENTSEPIILVGLEENGEPVETEYAKLPYDDIPEGMYEQEITRFQKPFQMKRPAIFMKKNEETGELPNPFQTKTRLEILILDGPHAGKMYYPLYSLATGETATLGKLVRAITQEPIPRRWGPIMTIGLRFRSYVQHSKDVSTGKVKLGKENKPFPEPAIGTVNPLNTEPLPDSLQPMKPSEQRASASNGKTVTRVPDTADPRQSWVGFWNLAERYGFTRGDHAALSKLLELDTNALNVDELHDAFTAAVKHPAKAPF